MRRLSSFHLLFSLAACSSWKVREPAQPVLLPFAHPPAGFAEICAVRTSVLAQAVTFPTRDNGVLVGATKGPTHFCWLAGEGHHEISVEADDVEIARLWVESGKRYWMKQELDFVFGHVSCRAVWVSEDVASKLLELSSHEVLVGVPGDEALPPPVPLAPGRRTAAR